MKKKSTNCAKELICSIVRQSHIGTLCGVNQKSIHIYTWSKEKNIVFNRRVFVFKRGDGSKYVFIIYIKKIYFFLVMASKHKYFITCVQ